MKVISVEEFNELANEGKLLNKDQLKKGKEYIGLEKYTNLKGHEKLMFHFLINPASPPKKEGIYFLEIPKKFKSGKSAEKQIDKGFKHHFDSKENDNVIAVIMMFRGLLDRGSIRFNEMTDDTDDAQIYYIEGKYKSKIVGIYINTWMKDTLISKILENLAKNYDLADGLHPKFTVCCDDPKILDEIYKKIKPEHCDWYD